MSANFEPWELEVLSILQDQLPLSPTPYDDIAAKVGASPGDVIALIERLRKNGVIRRFGASIRHQKSGYKYNAMVAWRASPEQAEECGPIAARFPAISHVYYRPSPTAAWPYTFYTMMHGRSEAEITALVEKLLTLWPLAEYAVLPTVRELKKISMTYFKAEGEKPSREKLMPDNSCELFREACKLVPGGVNSPVRACRNVNAIPLFIDKAKGSHIQDVDGREYIDYVLSWGPLLLGHAEDSVTRAIQEAASRGSSFGAPCPAEIDLAKLVIDAMPAVEMIRMVNSGTEGAMTALRLARGITGRDKVIKFIGCYHGHADPFLAAAGSGVATLAIPGTPGVPASVVRDTVLVPYNDLSAATAVFESQGDEIAAVIVEPVAANMGLVPPLPDFLDGLRQLCTRHHALLIFDEVITGFRLSYGGAQKRFAIEPDLTVFGKIIGGGLPVGCVGGRKKYMEQLAPAGAIYQAGTLSGNPLAMAAGIATLEKLRDENYKQLESRTDAFARSLCAVLRDKGLKVQVPSIASMFGIFFTENPVINFAEASACDAETYASFYRQMREKGVYLPPSPYETCMVSFAHTDEDFTRTLEAAATTKF